MTGKTHFAVGEAAALLLTHPTTAKGLALCLGAAAVGSMISDIDVTSSHSHRDVTIITSTALASAAIIAGLELHFHLGILSLLQRQTNIWRILLGLVVSLAICNFGMQQPHRSFMHSLFGWFLLTALVGEIFPFLVPAFALSMASHILLDLLNRKRVRLLYPLHRGFCLNLCPASGRINDLICLAGSAAAGVGLALSLWRIFL